MTTIRLTSDGYSFHTMELKTHLSKKDYNRAVVTLYQAARNSKDGRCRTYPLSKYQKQNMSHCSTVLSSHGILLYLTKGLRHPEDCLEPKPHRFSLQEGIRYPRIPPATFYMYPEILFGVR